MNMRMNLWDAMILGAGFMFGAALASLVIAFMIFGVTVILSLLGIAILGT